MPASIPYQAGPAPTTEEMKAFADAFTLDEMGKLASNREFILLTLSDLDAAMAYAEKLLENK